MNWKNYSEKKKKKKCWQPDIIKEDNPNRVETYRDHTEEKKLWVKETRNEFSVNLPRKEDSFQVGGSRWRANRSNKLFRSNLPVTN